VGNKWLHNEGCNWAFSSSHFNLVRRTQTDIINSHIMT
jgi:sarcosine oxidase delta subunit